MCDGIFGIGLLGRHLGFLEDFKGLVIVMFPGEAGGVEHHSNLDALLMGIHHGIDQYRIGELEHLDIQTLF